MLNKKLSNQKGFSLIELLVVIAIIGILAAIIAPTAVRAIESSRVAAALGDYGMIKSAVLQHYADTEQWPKNAGAGEDPNLMKNEDGFDNWNGPYLTRWKPEHPWGGRYEYSIVIGEVAKEAFNAQEAVVLEIQSLGDAAAEVYVRIKEELGEEAVEKKDDNVLLLIHKKVPKCS